MKLKHQGRVEMHYFVVTEWFDEPVNVTVAVDKRKMLRVSIEKRRVKFEDRINLKYYIRKYLVEKGIIKRPPKPKVKKVEEDLWE